MPRKFRAISSSRNDDYSGSTCGFDNMLRELGWLCKEVSRHVENPTEGTRYRSIAKAKANRKNAIVYWDCNPLINKIVSI